MAATRKNGEEIPVELSLSAVQTECGWQAVGILRDISARKGAEEELKRYTAALESSNTALEQSNRLAEIATRAKSEFLANMSHEIRTPMTAILGFTDVLFHDEGTTSDPAQRRGALETIRRNGEHLLTLINDILDLSKVEAGKLEIERAHCSPLDILQEAVSLMRVRADAKAIRLFLEVVDPLPKTIITDPLRLRQVLLNLLGNAIKFTDRGEVRVSARLLDESGLPRLSIEVADTGIGMSDQQIAKLFQPFSQVDGSASRKFGGTGLGLAISQRLMEVLGGKISVRSTPGQGSQFRLTIDPGPLDDIALDRDAVATTPTATTEATPVAQPTVTLHARVLLAEDGLDNQRLISFLLKKAGAQVTTVENGQLALETALIHWEAGHPFDVILMDMQMPVMDGGTAVRELRQYGYGGPIVALTAHAMADDRQACLDAGCNEYASKPIDRQRLLEIVSRWALQANPESDARHGVLSGCA